MHPNNLIHSKKIKAVPSFQEQERDITILDSLIEKYSKPLWSYLHKNFPTLLYQDKQDIIQDTWMNALHALREGKYNAQGKFFPWLCTIAHNLSINCARRNMAMAITKLCILKKEKEAEKNTSFKGTPFSTLDRLEQKDRVVIIDKCIQKLSPQQREVIYLRFYANMRYKEIEGLLRTGITTINNRVRSAIVKLKNEHEKYLRNSV